jgi:hypothetical protein
MNMPGFTAHASLYRANNRYRSLAAEPQRSFVIPQIGGPDFKGFGGCIDDCLDRVQSKQPTLTLKEAQKQCSQQCRDPLSGVDLSTPRNSFNDFLSDFGIGFWEGGCSATSEMAVGPFGPIACKYVADVIRRQS